MANNKSRKSWLTRQNSDYYVLQARGAGYRSRAAYKLLEIQARDKILTQGMIVVDLGAAPGGWSQVAHKTVGQTGQVLAIDILPMDPLPGVDSIQGDLQDVAGMDTLFLSLEGRAVDFVLSDMSPNLSGIRAVDEARSSELAEMALAVVDKILVKNGGFLIKVFQGSGFQEYLISLKNQFKVVAVRKPKASRAESREVYLLARGYLANNREMRGVCFERYA